MSGRFPKFTTKYQEQNDFSPLGVDCHYYANFVNKCSGLVHQQCKPPIISRLRKLTETRQRPRPRLLDQIYRFVNNTCLHRGLYRLVMARASESGSTPIYNTSKENQKVFRSVYSLHSVAHRTFCHCDSCHVLPTSARRSLVTPQGVLSVLDCMGRLQPKGPQFLT